MDDLLNHPECRAASADQAFSDYVWNLRASDIQNHLAGLSRDAEALRLHNELEDIIDQAVDLLILHSGDME